VSSICPSCGHEGASDDRFCGSCGTPLTAEAFESLEHTGSITSIIAPGPGTGSGPMSAVGSGRQFDLPSGSALLVVHRGPGEGQEFVLSESAGVLTVGRAPEADIFLDDVTVSRHHAEFRHGAEGWSVRDVGSLNGTYVNRARVEDQHLAGGDEVQIGKFRFVFLLGLDAGS
jgi:pSer/pThr/pTyr-binding forkhead associated (FHA) protein